MVKQIGLSFDELELMTVGSVIDYAHTYVEEQNPESQNVRKATQADFESF